MACAVGTAWMLSAIATRTAAAQDTGRVVLPCDGRIVSAIDIRPQVPYYSGYRGQWRPLARLLASLHAVTTPTVIESFLALHVGEPCTEIRRRESERILLVQPFLSEARVTAYDDNAGGVRVDVFTADEISLTGAIAVRGAAPHILGLRLGEANLGGQAIRVVGEWANGLALRDHYGGRITDYALGGRPYQLNIQGNRNSLGGDWSVTLVHPFFTDLQRIAWIVEAGEMRAYVNFLTPQSEGAPTLDFSRHYAQIGAVARVLGRPGNVSLFGLTISEESETPGLHPLLVRDSAVPLVDPALVALYAPLKSARLNAIIGVRDVSFQRVTGFDALNGDQDVLMGLQIGALVGHSVQLLGTTNARDVLVASGLRAGTGNAISYLGLQATGESRHDLRTHLWDDVLTNGRLAWYWKPARVHTVIVGAEYSLGLNQRLPFTLTLADLRGGIRGFHKSDLSGGERIVTRLEERWLVGPVKGIGELGLAAFADAGRIWKRSVPYGVNSPIEASVGLSLLASVPVRSKHLWRIDFAVPVTHDVSVGRYEIRFANSEAGPFYLEPRDVTRARERAIPTSIFQYPPQ